MSVRLVSYKDYVAGWLDSSIHDFGAKKKPRTKAHRKPAATAWKRLTGADGVVIAIGIAKSDFLRLR